MFMVKTNLKTASCSQYFRYSRMGASESIEVEEHLKIKACVTNSNGYSYNIDDEMRRKYKYEEDITTIPNFETPNFGLKPKTYEDKTQLPSKSKAKWEQKEKNPDKPHLCTPYSC